MKIFAFYLPQFHEIKENNEWHGKGFTEWTHVKSAKALYKGHRQPKEPYDGNYYNLLNKDVIQWQTSLAQQNGVEGFIYYHYWFNGKLLMEKPAENYLKWKDIRHQYFFCWANHSFEKKWDGTNKLLQEQTYGDQADWEKHFYYLLPFFQDERYEKINNKPILMIYVPEFPERAAMFEYFNALCKKNGFSGIHCIDVYKEKIREFPTEDKYIFEHMPTVGTIVYNENHKIKSFVYKTVGKILKRMNLNIKRRYNTITADDLYKEMMTDITIGEKIMHSVFFEWDNTPRYGKKGGSVIQPVSKKVFFEYMDKIKDDKYVFVNAWNEWAEGMILEPTKENGDRYLSWIKEWRLLRRV